MLLVLLLIAAEEAAVLGLLALLVRAARPRPPTPQVPGAPVAATLFEELQEARVRIQTALKKQLEYEAGHEARMKERLAADSSRRFLAHLASEGVIVGAYTVEQRRVAVEQRVRAAYRERTPPPELHQLVIEEVRGAQAA